MLDLYGFGDTLALGAWVTIQLSLAAVALGLVIGLIGAGAKLSRFSVLRMLADAFTTVIRGVPELLLILSFYFGGGVAINNIVAAFGYTSYVEVNGFSAGLTAIGINFGAYTAEIFRGAILAVPKGQIEAARSVGMTGILLFRRILLPQVWRFALPGLGNQFLVLQKNTALVSVIGVHELMRNTAFAVGYTKKPFTFYLFAAMIYLGLTVVTMIAVQMLEKRANRGVVRR